MSGGRVLIPEPKADQQEAAKQLVIWCGLRYYSLGVKLSVISFFSLLSICVWASERHAKLQVRLLGPATCVQKALWSYWFLSRVVGDFSALMVFQVYYVSLFFNCLSLDNFFKTHSPWHNLVYTICSKSYSTFYFCTFYFRVERLSCYLKLCWV